jgi:hypothetical protein
VDVESHGRHGGDLDLSRTVGWFTSVHPVRLDLGALSLDEVAVGGDAAGAAVKTVKEQLRAVPGDGLGYGLLRYLNPDTSPVLAALPAPQIGFNYLGRFLTGAPGGLGGAPGGLGGVPAGVGGVPAGVGGVPARLGDALGGEPGGGPVNAFDKGGGTPRYWQPARERAGAAAKPTPGTTGIAEQETEDGAASGDARSGGLVAPAPHPLEAAGMVRDDFPGGPRLVLALFSPRGLIPQPAIRDLAREWEAALRGLIAHAIQGPGAEKDNQ